MVIDVGKNVDNDAGTHVLKITNLARGNQIVKEVVYPGVKIIKEDVSSIATGVYLLSITNDKGQTFVSKFIKY